jgi:hypothetical protein
VRISSWSVREAASEARFRGNASKMAGIAIFQGESRFLFLSRASEVDSGTHPPGSSFRASKRGGGASGNPGKGATSEVDLFMGRAQTPFLSKGTSLSCF